MADAGGARAAGAGAVLVLAAALAVWMLAARPAGGGESARQAERAAFEERTGVRPVHVAVTGGGGLIDLRYQVVDPDKAAALHDPERPPGIVDSATGKLLDVPLMQHGHTGSMRAGGTYYTLLLNLGGRVHQGEEVAIAMGDSRLEHVRVK